MSPALPKVGIVGGAGPMAGLLLCQNLIKICQDAYGCQQDADFPYFMLLNYPFSDMLGTTQSTTNRSMIEEELSRCFETFALNGIGIAAVACNTLHAYLKTLPSSIHFLNILVETKKKLSELKIGNPLVLCSGTSATDLIHQSTFDCHYPSQEEQKEVDRVIDAILGGRETIQDACRMNELIQKCLDVNPCEQCDRGVVLGCTEFSVLHARWPLSILEQDQGWTIIDSTQVLAESICKTVFNKTL